MNDPIFRMVDGVSVAVPADEAATIWAEWQECGAAAQPATVLSREAFCAQLFNVGILTEAEATDAALGVWPATFEPALAGKSLVEKLTVMNLWQDTKTVAQDAPLFLDLLGFYAAKKGFDTAKADALSDMIFNAQVRP
jgi:hypothetical protein